jgi:hypothetical protein
LVTSRHNNLTKPSSLRHNGSNAPFRDQMADFDELNTVIGLPQMLDSAKNTVLSCVDGSFSY